MTKSKAIRQVCTVSLTSALCLAVSVAPDSPMIENAYANNTYSNLVNAQNKKAASAQREAELRAQLAGVREDLADKIVELDELTNTKIPAAQTAVEQANSEAASAQSEAEAASARLEAAQKDKENLEAQIEQTGKDYDDAHAAVAQMAREDMQGSDASTVMSVVTGSTSTQEFINSMQSRDALSRTESNAATDAANTLSTSMNRSERLDAIEKQIANLKTVAETKAVEAQQAAASAQSQRDALDQLRAEGESRRAELESQQSELTGSVAQQAAQTVLLQSQVDSYNRQYTAEQAAAANQANSGTQGQTEPSDNTNNNSGNNSNSNNSNSNNSNSNNSNSNNSNSNNSNSNNSNSNNSNSNNSNSNNSNSNNSNSNNSNSNNSNSNNSNSNNSNSNNSNSNNSNSNNSGDNGNSGNNTNNSGGTTGGQGTSNGDYGNAYVAGQCTWWAYNRRQQMGIGTPSYLGNGGQWYATAPSYGLRVDHSPQVGAAISFLPGQAGADGFYGHVGVVEAVYGDTITISEMNAAGGPYVVSYRTLSDASQYWYVH